MSNKSHNKIEIAIEQLEVALQLFLTKKSYVSALTLGGAAEEILGMALKIDGVENSIQGLYNHHRMDGLEWINPPKTWKEFITEDKNRVRNTVKHLSDKDDFNFKADIKEETIYMLIRATDNYRRLGFKPTSLTYEFDCWFNENYIGI